jgi:hypothetical protein
MKNSGRNRRSRLFRESNPKPLRLFRRSNRELHHPGMLIPRRMSLDRNDLGGELTVARTSRPRDHMALASFHPGFCLRVSYLLSRSVRIPANRDVRLRYLQSNGSPELCQDFFQKIAILAHFLRNRLILKYLPEIVPDGKRTRAPPVRCSPRGGSRVLKTGGVGA